MRDAPKAQRPNILWICTDQQRYDTIAALGNQHIRTPNLDRLSADGVAFARTYCQSPICTPSRASFLTGRYPSATHVNRNGNSHYPLEGPRLITRRLADVGYTCGLAGKLHLAAAWNGAEQRTDDGYSFFKYSHSKSQHSGTNRPGQPMAPLGENCGNQYIDWLREIGVDPQQMFETYGPGLWGSYRAGVDPELRHSAWCASQALTFMRSQRDRGPWLMSVNMVDPHPAFDAPSGLVDRYLAQAIASPLFGPGDLALQEKLRRAGVYFQSAAQAPDAASMRNVASYYGMIELIDHQVGRMIDGLRESGQYENTVIIFTSDHGEMLGDHGLFMKGCRFYEGLVRVPLIIAWPGHFRRGVVCKDLVELTDIAPTLAELAGVAMPPCDGRSLVAYLAQNGRISLPREFVRCEFLDALNVDRAAQTQNLRGTFGTMFFDGRRKLINYHGHRVGELYDLQNDPSEFRNLWDDPAAREIKAELILRNFDATVCAADLGPEQSGRY